MTAHTRDEIVPGFVLEWFDGHRIVGFTGSSPVRAAIDAYVETASRVMREWPDDRPFLVLVDSSQAPFTPYSIKRMHDLYRAIPRRLQGSIAVVLPSSAIGKLMRLFAERTRRPFTQNFKVQYFYDRRDALTWLAEERP